jgi:REP-associated tyrosine transposase
MQWFGTSYTRKFNLNNHIGGHLFQGRFKSIIVENDAYLLRLSCYIHRNPLRANIVERIADYPWSSYRYYAYKKKPPDWLKTNTILEQVSGADRHKAYRIKVQKYSNEQSSIWEDVKHGLIYGSQEYVSDLKGRFLENNKDVELPQHNSLFKEFDSALLLDLASRFLNLNVEAARNAKRIDADEKDKRDLLIYFLWKTGCLSNREIGAFFGLTYSAVSYCVKAINDRIGVEKSLKEKYNKLYLHYSQFKV